MAGPEMIKLAPLSPCSIIKVRIKVCQECSLEEQEKTGKVTTEFLFPLSALTVGSKLGFIRKFVSRKTFVKDRFFSLFFDESEQKVTKESKRFCKKI
jgi:hypothetical protein